MVRSLVAICFVSALSVVAHAQNVECRKSETQAECFTRLKCKADEELEACQKRLLKCTASETLDDCKKRAAAANGAGNNGNANGNGNNGNGDNGRGDSGRGDSDRGDNGRGDRGDNDRGDNGRGDRGDNGRGDRGDNGRGDRDRGRDSDRGGGRSRSRRGGTSHHGFEANKTFGLGLELGEPTGINGKVFISPSHAIDFGAGYIYRAYYYGQGEGLHLYGDFLFHPVSLASTPSLELPFYVGVGLRYWDFDYCVNRVCDFRGSAVGIRVPLGLSFDFNNVPLDIFIQLTPVLDFLSGDYYDRYRDREHFGIDFSVGIRFWFK